jgi:hypothetical protein
MANGRVRGFQSQQRQLQIPSGFCPLSSDFWHGRLFPVTGIYMFAKRCYNQRLNHWKRVEKQAKCVTPFREVPADNRAARVIACDFEHPEEKP